MYTPYIYSVRRGKSRARLHTFSQPLCVQPAVCIRSAREIAIYILRLGKPVHAYMYRVVCSRLAMRTRLRGESIVSCELHL